MFWKEYPSTVQWFHKGEKAIYWPNGSITEFSYLKSTDDVYTYQGREYEDISIDEITQHEEDVFKILRASNRTTNPEIKPTMILTGNPGGVGHGWCKRLFVDRDFNAGESPEEYDFVQSKVRDNRALMEADPNYIKRLEALPTDRRRAWLDGDWTVFSGQVFSEFRTDVHVINPLTPNSGFKHYLSIDWGSSEKHKTSFSTYATALVPMKADDGQTFNRLVTYQEWCGNQKYPDEWAGIIFKTAKCRKFTKGWTDASMHNPQSDMSIPIVKLFDRAWTRKNRGERWCFLEKGTRNRILRVATVHNWLSLAPDGLPYWLITSDCIHLIRTLPMLVYDDVKVEDIETHQEDHCISGDTLVDLERWQKPIKELVGMSGKLWSCDGIRNFSHVRCTGIKNIYEISLTNGKKVKCTSYHPFLTTRGWVLAIDLRPSDMILCLDESKCDFTDYSRVQRAKILQVWKVLFLPGKIIQRLKAFTQSCLGISQRENTQESTTTPQRLKSFKQSDRKFENNNKWGTSDNPLEQQKIKRNASLNKTHERSYATESNSLAQVPSWEAMAPTTRSQVKSIRYLGKEKVYNLDVEETHCFSVNGGILVHNCYDAISYLLAQIKWISATVGSFGGKRSGGHTMKALPMMPVSESGEPLSIDIDAFAAPSRRHRDWKSV